MASHPNNNTKLPGIQQKSFKTPQNTSKVSPSQARMAGKAREENIKNPNGAQWGFDAGFGSLLKGLETIGAVGKVAKVAKALTPKSTRIANAASRLYRESHAVDGALGRASSEIRQGIRASEDAYGVAKSKAYRDLGYRPGEAIDNMKSGTDAYSGSSYRTGRGTPRIGMTKPVTSGAENLATSLERQSGKALWKKGFSGIESDLKARLKTRRGK